MKSWCLGTRLVVAGTLLWLVFLGAHVLLAGRWWLWLVVETVPPVTLVVVPLLLLAVTPLARPVRRWLPYPLVGALVAGFLVTGVDVRAGGVPAVGARPISVFSWSTDVWRLGEDPDAFFRYLRDQDADVYLLQEYLYWGAGPVRLDDLERLRQEFPSHEIRAEGELVTLSRFPIVDGPVRPVEAGAQWYWRGDKAQRTDVRAYGRVVSFYNVHLQVPLRVEHSPVSGQFYAFVYQQYQSRRAELARLRDDVARNPNPVVIAGDFNSAWLGSLIRLDDTLVRHDPTTRSPLLATWPTTTYRYPRLWRLDWLYTTPDVRVHDYRFTTSLSDHAAQEIRISLKEDDGATH